MSALPRVSTLSSSPSQGHYVLFLGKTLESHSASLHPGLSWSKVGNGNKGLKINQRVDFSGIKMFFTAFMSNCVA